MNKKLKSILEIKTSHLQKVNFSDLNYDSSFSEEEMLIFEKNKNIPHTHKFISTSIDTFTRKPLEVACIYCNERIYTGKPLELEISKI